MRKICRFFNGESNSCKYGIQCNFLHEMRYQDSIIFCHTENKNSSIRLYAKKIGVVNYDILPIIILLNNIELCKKNIK